jgi:hypothetical protein
VRDFSAAEAERIAAFVKSGGGLILFPGSGSDVANYNEALFSRLNIPPLRGVAGTPQTRPGTDAGMLTFGTVDFAHPLFSGLFEQPAPGTNKLPAIESPRVYAHLEVDPGRQGHTIIALSDGSPFLTEYPSGSGRVLLYSVESALTWSDFPVKGLFVPLVHRSVAYLASQNRQSPPITVGDPVKMMVRLKNPALRDPFQLRSPGGIEERIAPRFFSASGMALFESANSSEAGVYELRLPPEPGGRSGDIVEAVAANIRASESDLRPITDEQLAAFWKSVGVNPGQARRLPAVTGIDKEILEARFGVELWKYFIGLALALALLEMAIGREPSSPPTPAHTSKAP